jgi:hypothetical protein
MAGFRDPNACYDTDAKPAPLKSDAPVIEQPSASVPLPDYYSTSGLDGGTRRQNPLEDHKLFRGMYDDNSPPPSTYEKLTDLDNLKKAGIDQAKQDPLAKAGLKAFNTAKEAIKPSPPLGTPEPAKKVGPLDFNFSFSPGAPSVEELRESSLANPDKQSRAVDEPRAADAGRTTYKEELPDGGTRTR